MFCRSLFRKRLCLNYTVVRCNRSVKYQFNLSYSFPVDDALEVCGSNLNFPNLRNSVSPKVVYCCYLLQDSCYENLGYSPKYPPVPAEAPELFKLLEKVSNDPGCFSSDLHSLVKENLDNLSFEEFLEFLHCFYLVTLQVDWTGNHKVLNDINRDFFKVFRKRASFFTVEEGLKCLSVLHKLKKFSSPSFYIMSSKLLDRVGSFTKHQLIYLMYLLTKLKQIRDKGGKFKLENAIVKMLPQLKPGDVGLISFAYYYFSQNFSHPDIINALISNVLSNIEETKSCYLTSLCLLLQTAGRPKTEDSIMNFQKEMLSHFTKFSVESSISILFSSERYNKVYSPLMDAVLDRVKENIKSVHKYSLVKLFSYFVSLKYQNEEFLNAAIEELKTLDSEEITYLVEFLMSLIHLQIFPEDVISKVMTKNVVEDLIGQKKVKNLLMWQFVQHSLEIEKPHLAVTDIDSIMINLRKKRKLRLMMSGEKNVGKAFFGLEETLNKLYGKEKYRWIEILPHFDGMIVMRFDKSLVPQEIPESFKTNYGSILKPFLDDHIWLCLTHVECLPALPGYESESGVFTQTKVRQLRILGYESLPITVREIINCKKSPELLTSLLNAKLQEIQVKKSNIS